MAFSDRFYEMLRPVRLAFVPLLNSLRSLTQHRRNTQYNRRVPVFMCRWPNGDLPFVSARNREDAIIALDELDNAEVAELRQVHDFMVDFRLTDSGDLELQGFGESCQEDIWNRAYPVLAKAIAEIPRSAAGEATSAGKKNIQAAVHVEKDRLIGKKVPKLAETELGEIP
jgi:hypothetical protein